MDPGLLTLGALAAGAALLPKFFKSRKEGFEVVPAPGYSEVVNENQEIFNKLTLSSDPRSEAVRVSNMSEADQNAYKNAMDSVTAPLNVGYDRQGPILTQGETENPVYIPSDDSLFANAAYCSTKPISGNVFGDERFNKFCGVCISGGTTHDAKQFKGQKGMYIHPEQKQLALENKEKKGELFTNTTPTYGYCDGATGGATSKYSFALDQSELSLLRNRQNCQTNRTLDGNCASCLSDGSYTFVGKNGRELDAVRFYIFGTNAVINANLAGNIVDFAYPDKKTTLVQTSQPRATSFSIILNEGAFLNFTVAGWAGQSGLFFEATNPWVVAEFWGLIEFKNSSGGVERIPLDRILLKDEVTGRTPKYAKNFEEVFGIYCRKMVKPSGQNSMIVTGQLPFLLVNNAPFTGIDCKGSLLQTLGSSVETFGGDPCYKPSTQGPGTWTDACLRDRIQTLGCTTNGNLFKDPSPLRKLTMTQIIQTIQETASKQYSENDSSQKCNGRNISTPCDPFVSFDPEETPQLSNQCISFLYFNQGADKPHIGPTYTGPVDSFASRDSNGKKIVCLPNAKMDPSRGDQFYLGILRDVYRKGWRGSPPGLDAVKKFMDYQFNRAVNTSLNPNLFEWQGGRKDNIELCFTQLANIPDNVLPDAKLPNARYCRIRFPPPGRRECIQISQVAVFDNRDVNVALNKPVASSPPLGSDCGPERAVDGARQPRGHPFEYHSKCNPGDYWQVDFARTYPIKRVEYYNRADCCWGRANGMVIELLNDSGQIVWSQTLDSNATQIFHTLAKNFNV